MLESDTKVYHFVKSYGEKEEKNSQNIFIFSVYAKYFLTTITQKLLIHKQQKIIIVRSH